MKSTVTAIAAVLAATGAHAQATFSYLFVERHDGRRAIGEKL